MQDLAAWVQDAILLVGLIATGLIGLATWQIKLLHSRIEKYHKELREELREHIKDSVPVREGLVELRTLLKSHITNGHKHDSE